MREAWDTLIFQTQNVIIAQANCKISTEGTFQQELGITFHVSVLPLYKVNLLLKITIGIQR